MKKVITVGLAIALSIMALSGCVGNSGNGNAQDKQASNTTSKSNASNSRAQQVQSSKSTTSAAAKKSVSETLNALNSNGQSIENMLKGIADDYADITVSDSQSNDADSMANQLNSYLNTKTDNINGLN